MTESIYQAQQRNTKNANTIKNDKGISYPSRTIVHAKLEMTEPGDHDEQEADDIANTIASGGKISRKISNGGSSSGITVSPQMENQLSRLQGGGQTMPSGLRHMMESGFGQDFSHVRLHTDSQAADMSSSISARAFTHGNDIYFNRGQFSPNTSEGQRLVAHELTHVVQGSGYLYRSPSLFSEDNNTVIRNTFPSYCEDFSERSLSELNFLVKHIKEKVGYFKQFRDGEFFNEGYDGAKNQEIPDIDELLFYDDILMNLTCKKNDQAVIPYNHGEITNFLKKKLDSETIDLIYEWMKYARIQSCMLSEILGLPKLSPEQFVKHKYKIHLLQSYSFSAGELVALTDNVDYLLIEYSNQLGMEWYLKGLRNSTSISFSISATPISGSLIPKTYSDNICNAEASSDTWYTPGDFSNAYTTLGISAEGTGGQVAMNENLTFGGFSIIMKDKKNLRFNSSGFCGGVGLSYDLSFEPVKATIYSPIYNVKYQKPKAGNLQTTNTSKSDRTTNKDEVIGNYHIFFDTGSYDPSDGEWKDENEVQISNIVESIANNYAIGYKSGLISSIDIDIIGHASPAWETNKTDVSFSKNLDLSKKRTNATISLIQKLLDLNYSQDSCLPINYMSRVESINNDTVIVSDSMGSYEGLNETNDYKNNDWRYRRVDIIIHVNRKEEAI